MTSLPRRRIVVAAVLLLLLAGAASAGEGTVRLVAQPDDPAKGLELGETVTPTPTRDTLYLDKWGYVLFRGEVRDSGGVLVQADSVYLSRPEWEHRAIAVLGEEVPQAGGLDVADWWIFEIVDARLSANGFTAVEARIRSDPLIVRAILTGLLADPRTSVAEHMTLPGICRLKRLGDDSFPQDWVMNGNTLTFQGQYDKDVCPSDHEAVFRRVLGDDIEKVFEDGDLTPAYGGTFDQDFRGLVSTEGGTVLLYAPFSDGPDYYRALVVDVPDLGEIKPIVARTAEVYPGTGAMIYDFRDWTIAPGKSLVEPRSAFIATVFLGVDGLLHVSDSAASVEPILATGDTLGGFEFTATEFTPVGLTLAGDDIVVVVGNTVKPGGAEVPGVWRYDDDATSPLALVLCEGETAGGLDAAPIEQIYTVNVNRHGRIAAEVLYQAKQTIIMEGAVPGVFRVAVQQGDQVPARSGTVELVGLLRSFPADPKLTGPGLDGRQSRFNERGEFVFLGRAVFPGGGIRSGVYLVSLDEERCDVTVKVNSGNLVIVNGGCDASITVASDAAGTYTVTPGPGTTINGEPFVWQGTVSGSVSISMGGGDDTVTMTTSAGPSSPPDVEKNLTVDGGPGDDTILITGYGVAGNMTVRTGTGEKDTLFVRTTDVLRNLKVYGGDGVAEIELDDVIVKGKTKVTGGGGNGSKLSLSDCSLYKTTLRGGGGSDTLSISDTWFGAPVKIDLGTGTDDILVLYNLLLENGGLSVSTKKSGYALMGIEEVEIRQGNLTVTTGRAGATMEIHSSKIQAKLTLKTTGSGTPPTKNLIDVFECDVGIWLNIRGKGSHQISVRGSTVAQKGIAINTKGGDRDEVTVSDNTVTEGLLQVQSKAASFSGEFLRNVVQDGICAVRTGKGNDEVVIADGSTSGILQVITSHGDDVVSVNGMTIGGDLRLGGGYGTDLLNNGRDKPNVVAGEVKEDSFEGTPP